MNSFIYNGLPSRVVFGVGALDRLAEELDRLGLHRALLISTEGQAAPTQQVVQQLGWRAAGHLATARMHVPAETLGPALDTAARLRADVLVAYGGGSALGLAKALTLSAGLPIVAIPTTYAGSEMTPIYGITEAGRKRTGKDPRVLPRLVVYDPTLTLTLPADLSVCSGLNAIAHAAEGLYAQDRNPITDLMAEQGIAALARALPRLQADPADVQARHDALYGAWLCGSVLGSVGMALHHQLCHILGGAFNLPHAQVHAVVLPHAVAFNAVAAPEAMRRLAGALQSTDAAAGLYRLAVEAQAPLALRDLGLHESDLDSVTERVLEAPYWNPRPIQPSERTALRALLQRAYEGVAPAA